MLYKSYFLAAICLISGASPCRAQTASTTPTAPADFQTATIKIEGDVPHPLTLNATDLAHMKRVDFRTKDHDQTEHNFSGVAVSDILQLAGVPMGPQLRGKNMARYLLVRSVDGYQVVFALPELDSAFSQRVIFLADQEDGKPLPAGKGPFRMVVPGEKKPARWIWEVSSLVVRSAKE
jgi:DMSO/TMAO reductase YedYZ molybdopterin-dependent catalytic subunit